MIAEVQLTVEEIIEQLSDCVDSGFYFELDPDEARRLLEHIRMLESMAEDDRGVL